jgi:hypothetical protein
MKFTTFSDLVKDTRIKICDLNSIVDVLSQDYKTASNIIDPKFDHRQTYLDQLFELNDTLSSIVSTHPAVKVNQFHQNISNIISAIAASEEDIDSVSV